MGVDDIACCLGDDDEECEVAFCEMKGGGNDGLLKKEGGIKGFFVERRRKYGLLGGRR